MPLRPDEITDGGDIGGPKFKQFKGLNNVVPPERLQPNELNVGQNIDIDNTFGIRLRKGHTQVKAGSFHSLWASESQPFGLVVENGNLVILYPDYSTSAPLATGISDISPVSYVEVNGVVYYSNGVVSGAVQNNAGRSWGLQPPPTPGANLAIGNLTAASYVFCATYVRNDGQESGNSGYGKIDVPAGATIQFTLFQPSDPTVEAIRVYMTQPNGEVLYRALEVPIGIKQPVYQGQAELLSVRLKTQNLNAPPAGTILALSAGRILIAQGQYLFYTEPFAYELCELDKNYLVYDSDIQIVAPVNEGVFIATKTGTFFHQGFDISKSTMVQKAVYGGIPGTLAYVDAAFLGQSQYTGKVAMWTSQQGIVTAGNEGFIKGVLRNLTQNFLALPASDFGSALFTQQEGINKYISLLRNSDGIQNAFMGDQVTVQVVRNGQLVSY